MSGERKIISALGVMLAELGPEQITKLEAYLASYRRTFPAGGVPVTIGFTPADSFGGGGKDSVSFIAEVDGRKLQETVVL